MQPICARTVPEPATPKNQAENRDLGIPRREAVYGGHEVCTPGSGFVSQASAGGGWGWQHRRNSEKRTLVDGAANGKFRHVSDAHKAKKPRAEAGFNQIYLNIKLISYAC